MMWLPISCSGQPLIVWELQEMLGELVRRMCEDYLMLKVIKHNTSMINRILTPNTTSANSCTAIQALSMKWLYTTTSNEINWRGKWDERSLMTRTINLSINKVLRAIRDSYWMQTGHTSTEQCYRAERFVLYKTLWSPMAARDRAPGHLEEIASSRTEVLKHSDNIW